MSDVQCLNEHYAASSAKTKPIHGIISFSCNYNLMIFHFQVVAFFGFVVITFVCGLVFHVVFEAPVLTLLEIMYEKLVERSKSNTNNNNNPC